MVEMNVTQPRTFEMHRSEIEALLAPTVEAVLQSAVTIPITHPQAVGRVLTSAVVATTPLPALDNSQMDGYAVRSSDIAEASPEHPVVLALGVTTAAGDPPVVHVRGTASPIMTGAPIPAGADAVVPVEATQPPEFPALTRAGAGAPSGTAAFVSPVQPGSFVRHTGSDIAAGSTVLEAGTRLTPSRIGAAAALGVTHVEVCKPIRVLLCATGDELIAHEPLANIAGSTIADLSTDPSTAAHRFARELQSGEIFDANTPMLLAALREFGADVTVLRVSDRPDELRNAVLAQLDCADLVVTTGGISKGAYEVVRGAFEPFGVSFGTVAMQPGGPQGYGALTCPADSERTVPILCFPGNPVSSMLSFQVFLAPTLREMVGLPSNPEIQFLPLAHNVESPETKHQIRRGVIGHNGNVFVLAPGSHLIGDLAAADLLVHLPIGVASASAGTPVETWSFND